MTKVTEPSDSAKQKQPRKWLWAAGLIIAVPFGLLVGQIDNWSRDLTTNFASTEPNAKDARLRPLELETNLEETHALIIEAVRHMDRWEVGDAVSPKQIPLKRTTAIFRFVDDIVVNLQTDGDRVTVNATSQSRVGKGDLGQNPRNIDQLFQQIRKLSTQHSLIND